MVELKLRKIIGANAVILWFYLLGFQCWGSQDENGKLILVQMVSRHGDRTPTDTYPNDPYKDWKKYFPEGDGQLTKTGKIQTHELGKFLRKRYREFLPAQYRADEVYVRSSDMDRTIMSAETILAGLYPPVDKWNADLNWQPIPVHSVPLALDNVIHCHLPCPKYSKLHHEFLKTSSFVRNLNKENKDFLQFVSKKSGASFHTISSLSPLQDTLVVQKFRNLTLPQWAEKVLPKLNELKAQTRPWFTFTNEMKRLHAGPFLKILLDNMERAAMKKSFTKLYIFSAHDSSLARIMNTLGIFTPHNPLYAAALLIELYETPGRDYYVKIFYRNGTKLEPYELFLPNCGRPCSLLNLNASRAHLIPENWHLECQLESKHVKNEDEIFDTMAAAAVILACFFIFSLVILIWYSLESFSGCCKYICISCMNHKKNIYEKL